MYSNSVHSRFGTLVILLRGGNIELRRHRRRAPCHKSCHSAQGWKTAANRFSTRVGLRKAEDRRKLFSKRGWCGQN